MRYQKKGKFQEGILGPPLPPCWNEFSKIVKESKLIQNCKKYEKSKKEDF